MKWVQTPRMAPAAHVLGEGGRHGRSQHRRAECRRPLTSLMQAPSECGRQRYARQITYSDYEATERLSANDVESHTKTARCGSPEEPRLEGAYSAAHWVGIRLQGIPRTVLKEADKQMGFTSRSSWWMLSDPPSELKRRRHIFRRILVILLGILFPRFRCALVQRHASLLFPVIL